jgi:hypothetical protein
MRTRANILSDKIQEKMDDLRFKVRTLDGGSCMTHLPVEENTKMKEFQKRRLAAQSTNSRRTS